VRGFFIAADYRIKLFKFRRTAQQRAAVKQAPPYALHLAFFIGRVIRLPVIQRLVRLLHQYLDFAGEKDVAAAQELDQQYR